MTSEQQLPVAAKCAQYRSPHLCTRRGGARPRPACATGRLLPARRWQFIYSTNTAYGAGVAPQKVAATPAKVLVPDE